MTWHKVTTAKGTTWHPSYGAACKMARVNGGTIARGSVPDSTATTLNREISAYLAAVTTFRAEGIALKYRPESLETFNATERV